VRGIKSWSIPYFSGLSDITKLPVVPLPKEGPIRDKLIQRGKKFVKLALGPHYLRYTGRFFRHNWYTYYYKGDGRIIIDTASFAQINPSYDMDTAYRGGQNRIASKEMKEDELYMCAPTLFGFSFSAKKWGQFYVEKLDGKCF